MFSIVLGCNNGASIAALPTTTSVVIGRETVHIQNFHLKCAAGVGFSLPDGENLVFYPWGGSNV